MVATASRVLIGAAVWPGAAEAALMADSRRDGEANGEALGPACPRRTRDLTPPSGFSPRPAKGLVKALLDAPVRLDLGNQLRPNRDHPDKQRHRGQRSSFLNKDLQHRDSP